MKKFMFLIALITLCCFGAVPAQAMVETGTGTISVTVSLAGQVSVSLTPTSWVIGAIALNTASSQSFTATVGNVSTDLNIKGSNGAGGWSIGTPVAENTFVVAVVDSLITLTTTDQLLATVAAYGDESFELTYTAPSADTHGAVSQDFTVTVTATTPL